MDVGLILWRGCREMKLEDKFKEYEAESYAKLTGMIQEQSLVPPAVFTDLLKKIYKRTK